MLFRNPFVQLETSTGAKAIAAGMAAMSKASDAEGRSIVRGSWNERRDANQKGGMQWFDQSELRHKLLLCLTPQFSVCPAPLPLLALEVAVAQAESSSQFGLSCLENLDTRFYKNMR